MTMHEGLPPAQRTVPRMLLRQAALFAGRPALKLGAARWTHADAAPIAARRAGALRAAGVLEEGEWRGTGPPQARPPSS